MVDGNGFVKKEVNRWLTTARASPKFGDEVTKLTSTYQSDNITFLELTEELQCLTGRTFNQKEIGALQEILLAELQLGC